MEYKGCKVILDNLQTTPVFLELVNLVEDSRASRVGFTQEPGLKLLLKNQLYTVQYLVSVGTCSRNQL